MSLIPSEQQAREIGERRTGGEEGREFRVFSYRNQSSGITFFAVEIARSREIIKHL
jgi:hypothetical protein